MVDVLTPSTPPSASTFIGIAIHNATSTDASQESIDLADGVRQTASGLLGTTVQLADLASLSLSYCHP